MIELRAQAAYEASKTEIKMCLRVYTCVLLRVNVTMQVCVCNSLYVLQEGVERREIETEVEQEQGHPFKSSLQRLCPKFLFILFHGSTKEEKEGMRDEPRY